MSVLPPLASLLRPPRASNPPAKRQASPPDAVIDPPDLTAPAAASSSRFPAPTPPLAPSRATRPPTHPSPPVSVTPLPTPRDSVLFLGARITSPPSSAWLVPDTMAHMLDSSTDLPVEMQIGPVSPDLALLLAMHKSPLTLSSLATTPSLETSMAPESRYVPQPLRILSLIHI